VAAAALRPRSRHAVPVRGPAGGPGAPGGDRRGRRAHARVARGFRPMAGSEVEHDPAKPAPGLIRGGHRFLDKIMLHDSAVPGCGLAPLALSANVLETG